MIKCIGIDVGRDGVKVVSDETTIYFKSCVGEWREREKQSYERVGYQGGFNLKPPTLQIN